VLECAGVHDILAKSLGSDNAINVVHATVAALKMIQRPEEVAARRGLSLEDVAPPSMLRQRREAEALAASAAREGTA
jgi:small subunit ribosomal protein S5